ncbi:MAG: cysteine desulfurase-like protein [Deinococcales bacterium]
MQKHFPALASGFSFLDNAAGAQVPQACIDGITQFLSNASCNVGMPYAGSQLSTQTREQTRLETAQFLNCQPDEVVIGPSATALTFRLSGAFARIFKPGDEIVISELEHECNASPWRDLERIGCVVKVWKAHFPEGRLALTDLEPLLSARTRLLAITSAANSLGNTPDVAGAVRLAHAVGAWVVNDQVHASPHHLPDVAASGVDFAFFSAYKVFSTHLGFMYVRRALLEQLPAQKLHFLPEHSLLKFEPGTNNFEAMAGWLGTLGYLRSELGAGLAGRAGLVAAYKRIQALEQPLLEYALERFKALPNAILYGEPTAHGRVGTLSFNLRGADPLEVATYLGQHGVGVAAGHCYATMPMQALGLMPNGAIRASIAHYSTTADIDKLFEALEQKD